MIEARWLRRAIARDGARSERGARGVAGRGACGRGELGFPETPFLLAQIAGGPEMARSGRANHLSQSRQNRTVRGLAGEKSQLPLAGAVLRQLAPIRGLPRQRGFIGLGAPRLIGG